MNIFTPPPFTPTKEQLLSDKIQQISHIANDCYRNMTQYQTTDIQILWNDSFLKPQEIIDALGDEPSSKLGSEKILTDAIKQIASISGHTPSITTPTNAFSIADGNITVSDKPYTL